MRITNWKEKLLVSGIFAAVLAAYLLIKPTCPILYFFHIPCPGCGMTRAYLQLLEWDILGAFQKHAMFWSVPLLVVYYWTDWRLFCCKWVDYGILGAIGLGYVINWVLHLI